MSDSDPRKVRAINPNGIGRQTLIEIGQDPTLKGFAIVCLWDDDYISTGWGKLGRGEISLMLKKLNYDTDVKFFEEDG